MILSLFKGPTFDVSCTLEISHTFDSLHAHCVIDGDIEVVTGDELIIHGAPIEVPFGEVQFFRRMATLKRAGYLKHLWTRLIGDFKLMGLCDFSFSERRTF